MRFGSVCSGIEAASCQKCKETKPASEFHRKGDGVQAWCKVCHNAYQRATRKRRETPEAKRAQNMRARYGIEPEEFERVLETQGGMCAICKEPPNRPVLDHDHDSGAVRGVLCHGCNVKLAPVEDMAFRASALAYLEKYK